jgi:hypothetical protein
MASKTDYSRCWANCLGDCAEGMSGEHYISQSVFTDADIRVQGFSWCKGEAKPIRVETLKTQILCKKHNTQLSDIDSAARASLNSIRDAWVLFDARNKLQERAWRIKRFEVDMLRLERWSLKTLINLNHIDGWVIGDHPSKKYMPNRELVEVVFGHKRFTDAKGLYMMARAKQEITLMEGAFSFSATTNAQQLVGGHLWLWGIPFYISIYPEPIKGSDGSPLMRMNMTHWFQTWDDKRRQVKSHCITFKYPSN